MYKIPPLKKNFRLLEDLNDYLVIGSIFHVSEIIANPRKRIKDRVYLTFTVKDNKDSPIKYEHNDGKPYTQYDYMTIDEFNDLKFEEYIEKGK